MVPVRLDYPSFFLVEIIESPKKELNFILPFLAKE